VSVALGIFVGSVTSDKTSDVPRIRGKVPLVTVAVDKDADCVELAVDGRARKLEDARVTSMTVLRERRSNEESCADVDEDGCADVDENGCADIDENRCSDVTGLVLTEEEAAGTLRVFVLGVL
jgi:hypothetical protein